MSTTEVPLSVILEIFNSSKPSNLEHVLKSLHSNKSTISRASNADIAHLISRVNNLLNTHDEYKRWYASHVIQILAVNPIVLAAGGSSFIVSLLKVVNDTKATALVIKNAVLALDAIIRNIRHKQVFTREILTPNLPNIISSLLDIFNKDMTTTLKVLKELMLKNTTTFKPFLRKFETKLVTLLSLNFTELSQSSKLEISQTYAYLYLVKINNSNTGANVQELPDEQWRSKIFRLLDEIRSVVTVYGSFIDLEDDRDTKRLLSVLPNYEKKEYIFSTLDIDLSDPKSIFQISSRLELLVSLLIAFTSSPTPYPIRVPLGLILSTAELLTGISLNYIQLKRELRSNHVLKSIIRKDITKTQSLGVTLIENLIKTYNKLLIPHLSPLLSTLEVTIPTKSDGKTGGRVDEDECLSIESELLVLLRTTTQLLKTAGGSTEYELVNKLLDISLLFLKQRSSIDNILDKVTDKKDQQKSVKLKKKKNSRDNTPLADLLSNSSQFQFTPPKATFSIVTDFFEIAIKTLPKLSPSYRLKISCFLISEGVRQASLYGNITFKIQNLLESLVLYPTEGETISVLPIVKKLLPDNEILSLLTNPRLPPLETKYRPPLRDELETAEDSEEDGEEGNEGETGNEVFQYVDHATGSTTINELPLDFKESVSTFSRTVIQENVNTEASDTLIQQQDMIIGNQLQSLDEAQDSSSEKIRSLEEDEDDISSKRFKTSPQITQVEETRTVQIQNEAKNNTEPENDSDSDFEMPNIEVESDEED